MEIIKFKAQYNKPIVLALGYFDCVHLGHKKLFDRTIEIAKQNNYIPALFCFSSMPSKKQLYNFEDRCKQFDYCGINLTIYDEFSTKIKNLSPRRFLQLLNKFYNIKGIVCGEDYKFGKNAQGDCDFIKNHSKNILFEKIKLIKNKSEKISTSSIRLLIENGEIEKANKQLVCNYFRTGVVVKGYGEGNKLKFPTANLELDSNLITIGEGVYATATIRKENVLKSTSFVGKSLTFSRESCSFETHIPNFNEELLGEKITVVFNKKIRDNKYFESADALAKQIKLDIKKAMS